MMENGLYLSYMTINKITMIEKITEDMSLSERSGVEDWVKKIKGLSQ